MLVKDFETSIARRIAEIPSQANRERVIAYHREREHGVKPQSLLSALDAIAALGKQLGERHWKDATREDVITAISDHRFQKGAHKQKHPSPPQKKLAASTKYQWSVHLQTFYKWLLLLEKWERPPQFKRLPFQKKAATSKRGTDLALMPTEVRQLLGGAKSTRDRLVIGLLLELGLRVSEAAAIRLENIERRRNGYRITIPSDEPFLKTGPREAALGLISCAPYLDAWLKEHPRRHDAKAPLLVSMSNRSQGNRMTGATVADIVTRCAKRAKMRHIHAHMMRHTSATLKIAKGWPPELIRITHGWTESSTMMSYYAHVGPHYEAMLLAANGLPSDEPELTDAMGSQPCGVCSTKNPFTAETCCGCGIILVQSMVEGELRAERESNLNFAIKLGLEAFHDDLLVAVARALWVRAGPPPP